MKILAIDTSCDETAAAVTQGTAILSNVIWSQASLHAKFGGVMPSLAARMHEERIDWVIKKAIRDCRFTIHEIDAVAVTAGPGLAIALEVGIRRARELAAQLNIPLIPVNHIEGHLLSPLARGKSRRVEEQESISWPAVGLVVSGGHTELVLIKKIGEYEILAQTTDDALGEALDKAARMLGLGYPGGAILEKMAHSASLPAGRQGSGLFYPLPLPMARNKDAQSFSYSGLKTAFWRLTQDLGFKNYDLRKEQICDLAASFQDRAFEHLNRVCKHVIHDSRFTIHDLLLGGGVGANKDLRRRLRKMCKELGLRLRVPYSTKLYGDNAGMIGVAAGFKMLDARYQMPEVNKIDREPRAKIDKPWSWEKI